MVSRIRVRFAGGLSILLFGMFAAGCGGSSPTSPSQIVPPPSSQLSAPPASVSSVLPASLAPSDASQTIMVAGSNFQPGLTVAFTRSDGEMATLGGSAIHDLTDTSFQVAVTVPEAGTYTLRVTNPSSPPSGAVTVTAQPTGTSRPVVAGLSPASPVQSGATQTVIVAGSNFEPGLSVALAGPGDVTATLSGAAIQNLTGTLFRLTATLADAGS